MTALSAVVGALHAVPMTEFIPGADRPDIVPLGSLVDDADLTRISAAALRAVAAPVLELHRPHPDDPSKCAVCGCLDCGPQPWPCPTARALGAGE